MTPPPAPEPAGLRAEALRARFDAHEALTVGLEEEVFVLDAVTHDLVPAAGEVLAAVDGDPRFKRELPAAQVELVGAPAATVGTAAAELLAARRDLVAAAGSRFAFAGAGVHPFAAREGELNRGPVYDHTRREFGPVARRQLVCGLHVHVAVPGADRAVAVHNGLRERLPELAALGANGAFLGGVDTGLASVRPLLSGLLPRQGVPPALSSLEAYAEALRWGVAAGAMPSAAQWWWNCACTSSTARWRSASPTPRPRWPTPPRSPGSSTPSSRTSPPPRATTRPPRPTPGASRRTAGRRRATASRARSPTS